MKNYFCPHVYPKSCIYRLQQYAKYAEVVIEELSLNLVVVVGGVDIGDGSFASASASNILGVGCC